MIVCAPAGVVAVTVTVHVTVPTGFAPWLRLQPVMLSELAGELVSVKVTLPAGSAAVPCAEVSFTVIVNCAVPPIDAEAPLVGEMVVVVVRALTPTDVVPAVGLAWCDVSPP